MLPSNVHKYEHGFTLVEALITVVVASILAAISVSSFLGLYNQNKVKNALTQLEVALREAQRQAMYKNQSCTVNLDTTNNQITSTGDCLVDSNILLDRVAISTNLSGNPSAISFSFKGNTPTSGTVVLSKPDSSGEKRCLAISKGLGIIRTGIYSGSPNSPITDSNCITSQ